MGREDLGRIVSVILLGLAMGPVVMAEGDPLTRAWEAPPKEAKLGAYWWWLNGNVTEAAITRDLEAMSDKGFGSVVLFDADGASQDGNGKVAEGPLFGSEAWRGLFRHTLKEAARVGISVSLNIQSGWNLGGPSVAADDAAKLAVQAEMVVEGGQRIQEKLPRPKATEYYQDVAVLAWRESRGDQTVRTSSSQKGGEAQLAVDGNDRSSWVSAGKTEREGPSAERPEWLEWETAAVVEVAGVRVVPRAGYGPKKGEVQISQDGKSFRKVAEYAANGKEAFEVKFAASRAKAVRLVVVDAADPVAPKPRNVQVAEWMMLGKEGAPLHGNRPIRNLTHKTLQAMIPGSAPDMNYLLEDVSPMAGEEDAKVPGVLDLTKMMDKEGVLRWEAPEGRWRVMRFGYTVGPRAKVSTSSGAWRGYAVDVFDEGAFRRYWEAVVVPLLGDANFPRSPLKFLHTDSWEIEPVNWTNALPAEFKVRRGYDLLPWLPVMAGHIIESREASNRFLTDLRRTLADLAVDRHYKPFKEWAAKAGLGIHPEAGGPHVVPIDAQQCLGICDAPMSEFWAESWRHRVGDANRFFVKQPASAAHTNGRKLVMAEGFTTVGPHWQERIWNNLKPSFDLACTEGLNYLVWHAWVCSPESEGIPGQQYFAGTHLNPNVTWWSRSKPFFDYINRCQAMLQRGLPVSDLLYYYGDVVPGFTQRRDADPAGVGPEHDYDVISTDVLLGKLSVKNGKWVLPDGVSYQALMLPERGLVPPAVLKKIEEGVAAGAAVIRSAARKSPGAGGRWIVAANGKEGLAQLGVKPDFTREGGDEKTSVRYIHRRDGADDIFFVASREARAETVTAGFRVSGKRVELWDPVSGKRWRPEGVQEAGGMTRVPLEFPPCGSVFVVFREKGSEGLAGPSVAAKLVLKELTGPWEVSFDPKWGGPGKVDFPELRSWTEREELGIRYYSGTATYRCRFQLEDVQGIHHLDLGKVAELAEVRLNGKPLGIVWSPPFRVEVTGALKRGENLLEVDVVNFWPNRIIGDAALPESKRLTRTNIRKLTAETPLMESGLLGPVMILGR